MIGQILHITGLLVSPATGRQEDVRTQLRRMPGVEIHALGSAGRLVVTAEAESGTALHALLEQLNAMPGVCSTQLVYHHSENAESQAKESDP